VGFSFFYLAPNIGVATINYRYRKNKDSLGVKVCIDDVQKAIQFLRFNSEKYNLDTAKIACYGSSAGAGMSLYFALHDDLATPKDLTLLGESTRLTCAGAIYTQAT
jgi:acetyl esterase/lipase